MISGSVPCRQCVRRLKVPDHSPFRCICDLPFSPTSTTDVSSGGSRHVPASCLSVPPAREAVGGPFAMRPAHQPPYGLQNSAETCVEPVRTEGTTTQPRSWLRDICWALRHGGGRERRGGRRSRRDGWSPGSRKCLNPSATICRFGERAALLFPGAAFGSRCSGYPKPTFVDYDVAADDQAIGASTTRRCPRPALSRPGA